MATWKVLSKDTTNATMVVQFNGGQTLNVPMPTAGENPDLWVRRFFVPPPVVEYADLAVGHEGQFDENAVEAVPEDPNVVGTWNEEYLRALIYTVLEEIRQSEV